MVNRSKRSWNAGLGFAVSMAMMAICGLAAIAPAPPKAEAVSVSEYQQKLAKHNDIKAKLAGVDKALADKIIELDDLTNVQIPAAQKATEAAQQKAEQAKSLADATTERLEAAQKDKADLEEKIKETGIEYDDAKDSVAEMARNSFHGSDVSTMMEVVTDAKSTDDFVAQMQSDAAATRSAANAANSAATTLNTSMNRKQRLAAIEEQIAQLKKQADQQAAAAQKAAQDASAKEASLEKLQAEGSAQRAELESQKSSLKTQEAKEAADIVLIEAELATYKPSSGTDNYTPGNTAQQSKPSGGSSSGNGGGSGNGGSGSGSSSGGSSSGGSSSGGSSSGGSSSGGSSSGANGMNYSVPGNCPEGSTFCYGHNTGNTVGGSAYPARQCTLWAYIRRSQLSLPVGSYMGNGAEWGAKGRALGYYVNNTPHVGAAMVFRTGQKVTTWYANRLYGHVAIVERINSDGSLLISEGGTGFATFPAWETVWPNGNEYVHY